MRIHHDKHHATYVANLNAALGHAIEATFESVPELKRQVSAAGTARFGSGWPWLIHDGTAEVST